MTRTGTLLLLTISTALILSLREAEAQGVAIIGAELISSDAHARALRVRPKTTKLRPSAKPKARSKTKKVGSRRARTVPATWYSISTKKLTAKRIKQRRFRVGDMGRRSRGKLAKNRGGKALYGASSGHGARVEKLRVHTGQRGRPVTRRPGRPRTQWGMVEYKLKHRAKRRAVDTRSWKRSQFYSYGGVPKGQRRGLMKNGVPGPKLCKRLKQRAERGYRPGQQYKPGRAAVGEPRALVVNGKGAAKSGRKRSNVILSSNMFRSQKGSVNKHVTQPRASSMRK
jgi:hypothetical protein